MDLNKFKLHICSKIGIDLTASTVNICLKHGMNEQFLAYPIEDDEALKSMWEHLKPTPIPSLE